MDVILVGVVIAFFALALLLVRGCERIIGPDEQAAVPARPPARDRGVVA